MRPLHVRAVLLLILVLLVAFVVRAEGKRAPALPVKDWKSATAFKVPRTIDGDTIEIEQDGKPMKVRLIGADTPETAHPSKRSARKRRGSPPTCSRARASPRSSTRTRPTRTAARWPTCTARPTVYS